MANSLVKNQEILLTIKRIGINGEGIGYYKRLAIFVDGVLPGEEIVTRITEVHDQYAKGVFVKFKGEKSSERVEPKCPYFGNCGGCDLQHCNYEYQLRIKKDLVVEAFDKYYNKELNPKLFKDTIGMENPWHYRNKVKLPVRFDGEKLVTGLYQENSNRLVYIEECLIEKEDIRKAVKLICEVLTRFQVIAYNPKTKEGVLRHIVVRSSTFSNEMQVTLILYKEDKRTIKIARDLIKIPHVESVYYSINDDLEAVENFGEKNVLIIGKETIQEKIGELKFRLLPTSFFQLNLKQTEKLYNTVLKLGKFRGTERVLDGYCGVGTIGLWVARHVLDVRGIDNNKQAIINANHNAEENGIENAKFYFGNLLPHLYQFADKGWEPDVLIVDPPRTGMDINLLHYLQKNPVKKIIYVSCNPATLAKNCNHLSAKYHILQIQPLDMFPQTSAVETVVVLERK